MSKAPDYDTPSAVMTDDDIIDNVIAITKQIAFEASRQELVKFQKVLREGGFLYD
jgi:hypothetical protein